jgi:uncharacterized DUF497 family protein
MSSVRFAYDPAKNAGNIALRGLSFDDVSLPDWVTAFSRPDRRRDYNETRMQAAVRLCQVSRQPTQMVFDQFEIEGSRERAFGMAFVPSVCAAKWP